MSLYFIIKPREYLGFFMVQSATEQQILIALKNAHTEIHNACHQIEHGKSKIEAKAAMARAVQAITNAFLLL